MGEFIATMGGDVGLCDVRAWLKVILVATS